MLGGSVSVVYLSLSLSLFSDRSLFLVNFALSMRVSAGEIPGRAGTPKT